MIAWLTKHLYRTIREVFRSGANRFITGVFPDPGCRHAEVALHSADDYYIYSNLIHTLTSAAKSDSKNQSVLKQSSSESVGLHIKKTIESKRAYLHDVKEHLLAQAVLLLKELVLGVRAGNVSADQLLAGWRHLQQFGILVLYWQVLRTAKKLPDDRPEVMWDAFPDQFL